MTSTQRKRIGEAVERMNSLSLRTLAAAQSEDCRGGEEGMTFLVSWECGIPPDRRLGKPWRSSVMRG